MTAIVAHVVASFSIGVWMDLVIALVWALESYLVQAASFPLPPAAKFLELYRGLRLLLDFCFCATLALLLPPVLFAVVLTLDYVYSGLLLAHAAHFRRPPSLHWLLHRERGSSALWPVILKSIPRAWGVALAVGLFFNAGLALLMLHLGKLHSPWWSIVPFAGWLLVLLALQHPLSSFAVRHRALFPAWRLAYGYGVLLQNLIEWWRPLERSEMGKVLSRALHQQQGAWLPGVPPWPARQHIIAMQMESVGWNALRHRIRGEQVMPFLFALAGRSLRWCLPAYHLHGTADMDFTAMTSIPPYEDKLGHFNPNLDYGYALPRLLHDHGYRSSAWHGNGGDFYARRTNFSRMGFDELFFREELRRHHPRGSASPFGWCVRDAEIFRLALEQLRTQPQSVFQFIITLDTHAPCTQIEESEKEIFPGSQSLEENYFNSLRVLDRDLERYLTHLPEDTLLVIFGDHTLAIHYEDFEPARDAHGEYVPCLVYDKMGGIVSGTGPEKLADGGLVHINDIFAHLRASVKQPR